MREQGGMIFNQISHMLKEIIGIGYFPVELPLPFNTVSFSGFIQNKGDLLDSPFVFKKDPKYFSQALTYNLARRNKIRRPASILNPINYYQLARLIKDEWCHIDSHYKKSNKSLSKPIFKPGIRAFNWEKGFQEIAKSRINIRSGCRYIVKTDISNFYPNIYTHSIPWALHSKIESKQNKQYKDNLGNKLDALIRNSQEGQTKGIPVGPDSSLIVAEIVLTSLDEVLIKSISSNYFRYMDDYEFGCFSLNEVDNVLNSLQECLSEYELTLNPSKTHVIELPKPINSPWVKKINSFKFDNRKKYLERSLLDFNDLIIELLEDYDDDGIVKYAIKKTSSIKNIESAFFVYQSILLHLASSEPGVLPLVIQYLWSEQQNDYEIDYELIKLILQNIIKQHAPKGHISEVSWSIWGMILFDCAFDEEIIGIIENIDNPVIALLTLDAQSKKLINSSKYFKKWASHMSEDELTTSNWLLAYEAIMQGWLKPLNGNNYLAKANGFSLLYKEGVSFYNKNAVPEKIKRGRVLYKESDFLDLFDDNDIFFDPYH